MQVQSHGIPTRVVCILAGALAATSATSGASQQSQSPTQLEPAITLVREVVYNELHDHEQHGWWRYWIEKRAPRETLLEEQVETSDGPLTRVKLLNGNPLDAKGERQEEERLQSLLNSPAEQASHKQAYLEDEKRIGRIVALLPEAFLYEDRGEENGLRHLHFQPNPNYPPHSIEARIFHAMSGDLWIDSRMKRMAELNGRLQENVDFGYGFLGRLYKGGWFELRRTQVSPVDWKTERLEIHMNGRAMLFKTIARETSEVRGGFVAVPAAMNLSQGMRLLDETSASKSQAGRSMAAAIFVKH
jgi:hypothetical protein